MKTSLIVGALAVSLLAGCTGYGKGPETAEREDIITRTAVVKSVDMKTREVVMRTDDDRIVSVVAGPEVRNLAQLDPGDRIWVDYHEAVAVRMADPADPGDAVGVVVTDRAAEGDAPGAAAGAIISLVVELISYDPDTSIATFSTPDGVVKSVKVKPEMRAFAAARKPGDRIEVTMSTAVAVTIQEKSG